MEKVVIDRSFWAGRRVLITGHTGFKGSWLSLLLTSLGAHVHGYALPPEGEFCVFKSARVEGDIKHKTGDVRDLAEVLLNVEEAQPEIIFHMAAQALVRPSYAEPVGTYATNVMGTVHLLEAARYVSSIRAVVVVTSDKCYENTGSLWGYRETDPLGGADPYSNSKGCAEFVASAYRRSFFRGAGQPRIATVRAGNVIGGGDWSRDRLVPDAIRAFGEGRPLLVRNPDAVRPWQHVLDPIIGYVRLAQLMVTSGGLHLDDGWNFGPAAASEVPVRVIVDRMVRLWGDTSCWKHDKGETAPEAAVLRLDCTKAMLKLGWRPLLELDEALRLTVEWYRNARNGGDMRTFTLGQISAIMATASTTAHIASS